MAKIFQWRLTQRIRGSTGMSKQPIKIKLSSLNPPASKPGSSTTSTKKSPATNSTEPARPHLLPGGLMLWCLVGLAIGLSVWIGGRTYLKRTLADQLTSASSEEVALQSIDALLRLDANATIEVSRGLAHPEFMVANAAFRALGGQLDAWTKLEPADRLVRMQKVVTELERIPDNIDQDHRILVSGLASRIYADTLSNREPGAGNVLEACRRILARTDPDHVPTRVARLDAMSLPAPLVSPAEEVSPVPPPLEPLEPTPDSSSRLPPRESEPVRLSDEASISPTKRNGMTSMSLSDLPISRSDDSSKQLHLTSGPNVLPHSTALAQRAIGRSEPTWTTEESSQPLSQSASSRSRTLPPQVEPLPGEESEPQPVALSGIEQLPIDQLVRLLSSVQPRVSQAAVLTLRKRGMTDENVDMAIQLATGSVETRQQLLDELVRRDDVDARPWLLWMAADGQEVVRQHAVALLQPLVDNDVRRQLRLLLNKERDDKVAQTMRGVLASR